MEILELAQGSTFARTARLAAPASPPRVSVLLAAAAPELLRQQKRPRVPAPTSPWKSADPAAQTAFSIRRRLQRVALLVRPAGRTRPLAISRECVPARYPTSHTGKPRSRYVPA